MELTEIYKKINDSNIKVFSYNIPETKAATLEIEKTYGIFINYNEIENSNEEFMVLAHEYGHCKSGSTHKLGSKYELISRHEYRANRKAVLEFLPIELLKDAIKNGCKLSYEFAEYLNLPEKFILLALKHYKAMNVI